MPVAIATASTNVWVIADEHTTAPSLYWNGNGWTPDVARALWLVRKQDAQAILSSGICHQRRVRTLSALTVVEHGVLATAN